MYRMKEKEKWGKKETKEETEGKKEKRGRKGECMIGEKNKKGEREKNKRLRRE